MVGTQRATFIVDESGTIAWCKIHAVGLDYVGVDELREALASLPASVAD
ncbi:MAG TPA: hypothetical protein VK501_02590 [Baekduia sp.]|nr:hypothetical protein [Baekduia sp.]HMJ32779.1 hypothetical protein [Baekduia sp.]